MLWWSIIFTADWFNYCQESTSFLSPLFLATKWYMGRMFDPLHCCLPAAQLSLNKGSEIFKFHVCNTRVTQNMPVHMYVIRCWVRQSGVNQHSVSDTCNQAHTCLCRGVTFSLSWYSDCNPSEYTAFWTLFRTAYFCYLSQPNNSSRQCLIDTHMLAIYLKIMFFKKNHSLGLALSRYWICCIKFCHALTLAKG